MTQHTLDYPQRNQTPDEGIVQIAEMESRIVVTKDSDFVDRFLLKRQPKKLLMISSGNITNKDLDALLLAKIPLVAAAFENNCYIEINRNAVIVHS